MGHLDRRLWGDTLSRPPDQSRTEVRRDETGDGRQEMGDERRETGDGRHDTVWEPAQGAAESRWDVGVNRLHDYVPVQKYVKLSRQDLSGAHLKYRLLLFIGI